MAPLVGYLYIKRRLNVWVCSALAVVICAASITIGVFRPIALAPLTWQLALSGYVLIAAGVPVWIFLQSRDFINVHILYVGMVLLLVMLVVAGVRGADVTQLLRLGFPMSEMAQAYSLHELHRAGYHVRDLSSYFSDEQLKSAGFSAAEMRIAGRSIRQLQSLGYNENHIRTAGYSLSQLIAAGLAKQTRDVVKGM